MLFIFAFLLILPVGLAQQEDIRFYHEAGTNLTIYEKCRIDGAKCDDTFGCTATILSPGQLLIINNETMEGPATYYNFTLNETQTVDNGIYETTVDCTNSSDSGSNTFFYEITPDGSPPIDEGQSIVILGGILLLIIIACALGWMGFRLKNGAVGLSLIAFSVLIFIFGLGMIANIFQLALGTFSGIISNYSAIYILFIILSSMGGLGLIIWLIVFALKLYWRNRGMSDLKDF